MEKSGLRTAAKPLGGSIILENAVFLLKKHEIAAFVVVDKSGYFDGCGGRIRTNDLRVMRASLILPKNCENLEISANIRIILLFIFDWFRLSLRIFEAFLPLIHPKIGDLRVENKKPAIL